jgi:DNA-binding CsgD family transcriptional regulator
VNQDELMGFRDGNGAPASSGNLPALTAVEHRLLQAVAAGLRNRQIAEKLGKSENTVRNQLHALFGKLGASNRAEAAVLYSRSVAFGDR